MFSHVYFGLIKDRLYVESFFIDVAFKQERKRIEVVKKSPFRDYVEYKPWNSFFYKKHKVYSYSTLVLPMLLILPNASYPVGF